MFKHMFQQSKPNRMNACALAESSAEKSAGSDITDSLQGYRFPRGFFRSRGDFFWAEHALVSTHCGKIAKNAFAKLKVHLGFDYGSFSARLL
jgi:hypothetical protein